MTRSLILQPNLSEAVILQERIRQARWGFNLSLTFVGMSAVITITGVILLLGGRISQGGYATLGGLTSTAVGHRCVQLSKDANDRLDRLSQEQEDNSSEE